MNSNLSIILIIPLIILFSFSIFGQGNTKGQTSNVSNALEIEEPGRSTNTSEWYTNQKQLWDQNRHVSVRDANAWYNYYKAYRFSNYSNKSKTLSNEKQDELDRVVKEMEETVPDSYEYNYIKYWNGNYDISLFHYLLKAYELQPKNVELFDDFIAYYELTDNSVKKKEFCGKWYHSNDIPEPILQYNSNVLMSLEKNAILITNGVFDTYPVWMLQDINRKRIDVTVLYIDLLINQDYTKKKLSSLGLTSPSFPYSEFNKQKYLVELASLNKHKPIYFALTVSPDILKSMDNSLYITGLAFKYSPSNIDNVTVLLKNWNEKMNTDYLFKRIESKIIDSDKAIINKLNLNYIMPMLVLYEFYLENNDNYNATRIKDYVLDLAVKGGSEAQVRNYLKKF